MEMLMITKQCFYGPPEHFNRMRAALAKAAGIPTTHIVVNDEDDVRIEVPNLDGFDLVEKNIYGDWDEIPEDPILILLAHSDEFGDIAEEHMLPLVARLSELIPAAYDAAKDVYGEVEAHGIYNNLDHFTRMLADAYAKEWEVKFRLEVVDVA